MPRQIAIRLGTEGKAQVVADLDSIGKTGDAAFNRVARSAERAGRDADAAIARANQQATKLAALLPGLNPTKLDMAAGIQEGTRKSAESSAAVFSAAYAQMERRAEALRQAIDPVYAAQQRFNKEVGDARTLIAAGAISLDEYVAVLRREQAALDSVGGTAKRTGNSFAAAAPQIQDLFTQISMGANPINALIVQGGQLAGQLQYVDGAAGTFARTLMGPWGVAFQVAVLAAGPFVAKLWEESEASKKAKEAAEQHRRAIIALQDAQEKAILTAERKQAIDVAALKTAFDTAMATRQQTQALLQQALQEERVANQRAQAPGQRGENASLGAPIASGRAAALEKQLADNTREMAEARKAFDLGFGRLVGMKVDARSTPTGLVNAQYEAARSEAMQRYAGDPERLAARLRSLNTTRDAELERIKKLEEAERKLGEVRRDGETLTANAVAKMLRGALPGVQITSTTGGKHVANSYHYRPGGQAVDFVPAGGMSSMTKADVRRLFESRGIEIVELLGPGDPGHNDHFHVAWTKGKLALDGFTDAAKRARDEAELLNSILIDARGADIGSLLAAEGTRRAEAVRNLVGNDDPLKVASGQELQAMDAAEREIEQNRLQAGKERVQELASFYQTVFNNGTGSIWDLFRQRGLQALADLLAKWTVGSGGSGGLAGGLLGLLGLGKSAWGGSGGISGEGLTIGNDVSSLAVVLPKLAGGTEWWGGGAALLGEHGPEIASLPRGTRVSPASSTRRFMAGNDNRPAPAYHFHLEGAVVTQDLLDQMNAIGAGAAIQGAAGGAQIAQADASARTMRRLGRSW